jgi:hypothetical protein
VFRHGTYYTSASRVKRGGGPIGMPLLAAAAAAAAHLKKRAAANTKADCLPVLRRPPPFLRHRHSAYAY